MTDIRTFSFSEAEARKLRRGAFLPILVILPIAAMFGADSSKHQPTHFLLTFGIGIICAAVIVLISSAAARKRAEAMSRVTLSVGDGNLVWESPIGKSELYLRNVTEIAIRERRGRVRVVTLKSDDGTQSRLEGYENMDELARNLSRQSNPDCTVKRGWFVQ
jgi:hypothetical protein